MNCTVCGAQLPSGARNCPNCGTPTPEYFANSGASLYDPTVLIPSYDPSTGTSSAQNPTVPTSPYNTGGYPPANYTPARPATSYNTAPPPPATPYAANPYDTTTPYPYAPPPAAEPRSNMNLGVIIASVALVVILVGAGVVFLLLRSNNPTPSGPTPAQLNATATAAAQSNATATAAPQATATAMASQNPYPPNKGTLVLSDPLQDNSKGYKWDEANYTNPGTIGSCGFMGNTYHAAAQSTTETVYCLPEASSFSNLNNFAFEANMTIVQGDDAALIFHASQTNNTFYKFTIFTNGNYVLEVASPKFMTLKQGSNKVIKQGVGQSNLLAVVANGNNIGLYVNGQFIDGAQDSTLSGGQIAVATTVYPNASAQADVIASNVRLWTF